MGELVYSGFVLKRTNPKLTPQEVEDFVLLVFGEETKTYRYGHPKVTRFPESSNKIGLLVLIEGVMLPYNDIRNRLTNKKLGGWFVYLLSPDFGIKRNPNNGEMEHHHVMLHNHLMRGHGFLPIINIFSQEFSTLFGDITCLSNVAFMEEIIKEHFSPSQLRMLDCAGRVIFTGNTTPKLQKHQKRWQDKPSAGDYTCMEVVYWSRLEALQAHYLLNKNPAFSPKMPQFNPSLDGQQKCQFDKCAGLGSNGKMLPVAELMKNEKYIPLSCFDEGIISDEKLNALNYPCRFCEKPYNIIGISSELNWLAATCDCDSTLSKYTWDTEPFFRLVLNEKDLKNLNRYGNVRHEWKGLHRFLMPLEPWYRTVEHFRKTGYAAASSAFKLTKLKLHEEQTRGVVVTRKFVETKMVKRKVRKMTMLEVDVPKTKLWSPDGFFSMRGATIVPFLKMTNMLSISYNMAKSNNYVKAVIEEIRDIAGSTTHSRVVLVAALSKDSCKRLQLGDEVIIFPKPPKTEYEGMRKAISKWRKYRERIDKPKPMVESTVSEPCHLTTTVDEFLRQTKIWYFEFKVKPLDDLKKVAGHLSTIYLGCDVLFDAGNESFKTTARVIGLRKLPTERHIPPEEYVVEVICKLPEEFEVERNKIITSFWVIYAPSDYDNSNKDNEYDQKGLDESELVQEVALVENKILSIAQSNKRFHENSGVTDQATIESIEDEEFTNYDEIAEESLENSDGEAEEEFMQDVCISPELSEYQNNLFRTFQEDFDNNEPDEDDAPKTHCNYFDCLTNIDSYSVDNYKKDNCRDLKDVLKSWRQRPDSNLSMLDFLLEPGTNVDHGLLVKEPPLTFEKEELLFKDDKIEWLNYSMNMYQVRATDNFMTSRISITQGPPGSGKSSVLAIGVAKLHLKAKGLIVVTSQSNEATKICYQKIKEVNQRFNLGMKLVYMLAEKRERADLRKGKRLMKDPNLLHVQVRNHPLWEQNPYIKNLRKKRRMQGIAMLLTEEKMQLRMHERKIVSSILCNADVIICTVSCATDSRLESALQICNRKGKHFVGLIVDEASLLTVPSLVPILTLEPMRLWLLGDQLQLRASVEDESAKTACLDISMQEYFSLIPAMRNEDVFTMLQIQYRMAVPIANVISKFMYHGKVKNSKSVLARDYSTNPVTLKLSEMSNTNVAVYSYRAKSEQREEGSYSIYNMMEVEITQAICEKLKRADVDLSKVVIISMYDAQLGHLRYMLQGMGQDYTQIQVASVDSMQGFEGSIVIINMVRSNSYNDLGFLRTSQRNNVGFSRAIDYLFVVGDVGTLWASKIPDMQSLLMEIAIEKATLREFFKDNGRLFYRKLVSLEEFIVGLFPTQAQEKFLKRYAEM